MSQQSLTTRMPGGVTNAAPWQTMAESGCLDPTWVQSYLADFGNLGSVTDFTSTYVGAGTNSLVSNVGGAVRMITGVNALDANYMQTPLACFQLRPGRHHFFKGSLMNVTSVTSTDVFMGLISASTTPLAAPDGLFFWRQAGGSTIIVRSVVGGVATDYTLPPAEFATLGVYAEVGLHIDPEGGVSIFRNPTTGALPPPTAANGRGRVGYFKPGLTQALLGPSFGVRNGVAGSTTTLVDFIYMQSDR